MHRGSGYIQNYLDGAGLGSLEEDLTAVYQPVIQRSSVELFVARQWQQRSPRKEKSLLKLPGVRGLVFSSFRHDNPGAIRRNVWKA